LKRYRIFNSIDKLKEKIAYTIDQTESMQIKNKLKFKKNTVSQIFKKERKMSSKYFFKEAARLTE
jgi:hypothetical protein